MQRPSTCLSSSLLLRCRPLAWLALCRGLTTGESHLTFARIQAVEDSQIGSRGSDVLYITRRRQAHWVVGDNSILRTGVLIVGGGLTGLTTAYRLQCMRKNGLPILSPPEPPADKTLDVFKARDRTLPFLVAEAAAQVGGSLETQRSKCGEFLWDSGANSFRLTPQIRELVQDLGLSEDLVLAPKQALRFVAFDGRLHPLPHSLSSLVSSPILSWKGKAQLVRGVLLGARPWLPLPPFFFRGNEGETAQQQDAPSISSYISDVLGSEVEKVVGAMVTGIYAGDPASLSMRLALPALKDMLDKGVLRTLPGAGIQRIRALLYSGRKDTRGADGNNAAQASIRRDSTGGAGGSGPTIANFRYGMHTLAMGLAEALPPETVQMKTVVTSLVPMSERGNTDGFLVTLSTPQGQKLVVARHVLLTVSPTQTAQILGGSTEGGGGAPLLGTAAVQQLLSLPFTSLALVTLAIRPVSNRQTGKASVGVTPNGFGFLVSPWEAARCGWLTLGGISVSRMFTGRAPAGSELFTAFVGGYSNPSALQESDECLVQKVVSDLQKMCAGMEISLMPDPEDQSHQESYKPGEATGNLYYFRVLGVRRWCRAVAQFGLEHSAVLDEVNRELLQQQQQRYPNNHLLIEGGWVSGVAVGDRVFAGLQAADILAQPVRGAHQ